MALKVDYVLKETGNNLRRNFSLTIASLLTVAVSLSLVGAAFLLRQGVDNATARWRGGIEFIVFMQPEATADQIESVRTDLEQNPEVRTPVRYVDKQAAYEEARNLFRDQPELFEPLTVELMPSYFAVVPVTADTAVIKAIGNQFRDRPGVYEVKFAEDSVESVLRVTRLMEVGILVTAAVLLGAASMLILNTIRMAMFARRREIEVMKLVGATNWFIRVPFMLEGMIQGLFGALIACVGVVSLDNLFESRVSKGDSLAILRDFSVAATEVRGTCLFVVLIGVIVGTVGSGFAVTRFLDV